MIGSRFKVAAALGVATVALASPTLASPATAAGPANQPASDHGVALTAAAQAYRTVYPQLSPAAAQAAAGQQQSRKSLYTALAGSTFGGAWYDAPTGVLHVAVTTPAAQVRATTLGRQLGLRVTPHAVRHSFADLQRQADALRSGASALSRSARGHIGIDVTTNRVVAAVPSQQLGALASSARPAGVALVADPQVRTEADAGCTSRTACDWTVRAGAVLWRSQAGNNVCSVGFTARDSSNQRYVYTAGHCSNGNGVTWGTGALPIGPMWSSRQSGSIDASIIKVTNSWFASDLGGEIYHETAPNRSLPVKGVAPSLGFIWSGDVVCLSANYTQPNGPNYCGVVGTNSDPAVLGMVRVDGFDGCPGDSGGGWYWLPSSGNRYAYGLHSRSEVGCHGANGHSWFSPLPTIKSGFTPGLNVETR
jgi:streptogrisin C